MRAITVVIIGTSPLWVSALVLLLSSGCGVIEEANKTQHQWATGDTNNTEIAAIVAANAFNITHPRIVGTTEDGILLKEYTFTPVEQYGRWPHHVYVASIGGTQLPTLSANKVEQHGKSHANHVTVLVNGTQTTEFEVGSETNK